MSLAEKIARERGIVIPDESKANSAAMSAWIKCTGYCGAPAQGSPIRGRGSPLQRLPPTSRTEAPRRPSALKGRASLLPAPARIRALTYCSRLPGPTLQRIVPGENRFVRLISRLQREAGNMATTVTAIYRYPVKGAIGAIHPCTSPARASSRRRASSSAAIRHLADWLVEYRFPIHSAPLTFWRSQSGPPHPTLFPLEGRRAPWMAGTPTACRFFHGSNLLSRGSPAVPQEDEGPGI